MDGVLRNIVEWGVADLRSTLRLASAVPAGSCGVGDRKGRLAPGYDADLVAVDDDLKIAMTVVSGRVVYLRESSRAQVG
jgi:N-acetylglucosamine-6-phosphate deacetylase